jgi:KaiC/GvpD/RAD55 family RecA-like ATPase
VASVPRSLKQDSFRLAVTSTREWFAAKYGPDWERIVAERKRSTDPLAHAGDAFIRWPWPALDALTGGMAPGSVHYVVGYSGGGKSTFLRSAILRWALAEVPLSVLPLEETADTLAVQLACHALTIDPGAILSGDAHRDSNATALYGQVRAERDRMMDGLIGPAWAIEIHDAEGLDLLRLEDACAQAAERQRRLVIVDHVDHLTEGGKLYESSVAVNRGALRLAQRYGLVLILASQANQGALAGTRDHLAKYAPLRDNHVAMGGHKRQIASSMLGLFRPIRPPSIGESSEAYQRAVKLARDGTTDPQTMLLPGVVGINLMKSRSYGSREGRRVMLRWRHGQVIDPSEEGE